MDHLDTVLYNPHCRSLFGKPPHLGVNGPRVPGPEMLSTCEGGLRGPINIKS